MERQRKRSAAIPFFIAAAVTCLPFLILLMGVLFYETELTKIDGQLGTFFHNLRSERFTPLVIWITTMGDVLPQTLITIVCAGLLWIKKQRKYSGLLVFTMLIGSLLLNHGIKEGIQRIRPTEVAHLIHQGGYSFPSGHAMGTTILFGTLIFIIWQNTQKKSVRLLATILFPLLILSIACSRVYLGVHFVSDIVAGISLGMSFILSVFGGFKIKEQRRKDSLR